MDHGFLNTSLKSRGDIDAQIDRYKAEQARQVRTASSLRSAQLKNDRAEAKALFAAASDARIEELALRIGRTPSAMRKYLRAECHWQPKLILSLFA